MNIPYPPPPGVAYTGGQVKAMFNQSGTPVSDWAESNGYDRRKVYMVINGQLKGRRGISHRICVELGMKLPPPVEA